MSNPIKQAILEYQLNKCHKTYARTVERLRDPYKMWINEIERSRNPGKINVCEGNVVLQISFSDFAAVIRSKDPMGISRLPDGWFMLCLCQGDFVMPSAGWQHFFDESSQTGLVYADEDMTDEESKARYGAWFKPEYSPDTLLSFFYFGSLLFLYGRPVKAALEEFTLSAREESCTDRQCLYDFILFYTEFLDKKGLMVGHIPQVLFHGKGKHYEPENPEKPEAVNEYAYWGYGQEYDACKLAAVKRRGYRVSMRETEHAGRIYHIPVFDVCKPEGQGGVLAAGGFPLISIVIPSKDNPEVLAVCIKSIYEKTTYPSFEIILVDNGSNEENRSRICQLKKEYDFTYIYEPMPFNFSKMCNLGVSHAKGDYILLLNDDMEILQQDWLNVLVGQAAVEGVGAVGAKLLYPDSDIIQHVGITNLWVGPAHKLLKEHDSVQDYYYGRNVLPYDMIGVTAACLMVSKAKYLEAGSFCEDIAVSYNDVDFCFSLYGLGYRNVIRNDVVLYHHESLSRGDDAMSETKWDRLLHEKDFVYKRHASLKGKDPYYNPNLAGFKHKYFCSFLYPYEQRHSYNQIKPFKRKIPFEWHNDCLTITLEHARLERKLDLEEEKDIYWLEGWAYVLNMDNSRYKRTLLLIDEKGQIYEAALYDRYRQDVVDILPKQVNVGLSGFSCRIKREDLKPGEYKVALLYRDCCSRQRLYKECDKTLVVE